MPRIVSIWLKAWPIARFLRAQARSSGAPSNGVDQPIDPGKPFVLVAPGTGGPRLVALNHTAAESGLAIGELLSNARSKVLELQSREADPETDDDDLRRLALWCLRYTPLVAPWDTENGADGLFLDIAGCAHLFGGEEGLLADLARRLRRFGLKPRLAVADTAGTAWALVRYGGVESMIAPSGEEEKALRDLPLAALRLDEETRALLRRLGFRRIGELLHQPRAPLAARFGAGFLRRLDQALGRAAEPLSPLAPPPAYRAQASFAEAISTKEHVVEAATRLFRDLARQLAQDGVGVRRLRLLLFRMDGEMMPLEFGLAAPSQDAAHVARLIALRLDRLAGGLETDFGFEAAAIHVLAAEHIPTCQVPLALPGETPRLIQELVPGITCGLASLIDRLEQRLGEGAVQQLQPRQSHLPERAVMTRRATDVPFPRLQGERRPGSRGIMPPDWTMDTPSAARPLLLLQRPEPAEVMAEVPEGPPRQFRWRGVLHQVAAAEGPERIAPEWWRPEGRQDPHARERDYYIVEDAAGRRFWLYRAGLYGREAAPPRWFLHGLFP